MRLSPTESVIIVLLSLSILFFSQNNWQQAAGQPLLTIEPTGTACDSLQRLPGTMQTAQIFIDNEEFCPITFLQRFGDESLVHEEGEELMLQLDGKEMITLRFPYNAYIGTSETYVGLLVALELKAIEQGTMYRARLFYEGLVYETNIRKSELSPAQHAKRDPVCTRNIRSELEPRQKVTLALRTKNFQSFSLCQEVELVPQRDGKLVIVDTTAMTATIRVRIQERQERLRFALNEEQVYGYNLCCEQHRFYIEIMLLPQNRIGALLVIEQHIFTTQYWQSFRPLISVLNTLPVPPVPRKSRSFPI